MSRFLEDSLTGSTIKHFAQVALRLLQVPVPPAAARSRIAAERASLTLRSSAGPSLALLDRREQAIAKAFRGDLVPQDPADEPAAVLERIRVDWAVETIARRRRRKSGAAGL
jgi:type I restriction enzyme S subunit